MQRTHHYALLLLALPPLAACAANFTRTEDVVYGRKHGVALTLDVFTPKANLNGAAVVFVVSGGWFSAHEAIPPAFFQEHLSRGYTVFAVVHGSQPKYTIPEVVDDMHRSIRFIRHNAQRFHIHPDRIGITGGSAGGHLSLMMGLAGAKGKPNATDPVERESSRVQAVGCFFPPTDFLNYGQPGRTALEALKGELAAFRAPFDFTEVLDDVPPFGKRIVLITDEQRRLDICKQISPITHVSADDPPTFIVHGDADKLVPIEQSERLIEKLKAANVTAGLKRRPNAAHGWGPLEMAQDIKEIADWFDKYLKAPTSAPAAAPASRSSGP